MRKNKLTKYSIGLDIGTNSVGWAITDDNFNLMRKGNKNLWGSRLFDTAQTAAKRRVSRSTRRRYNKRRERIRLLREIMSDMVLSVDPSFFIKMNETSFLDEEDKSKVLGKNFKGNYNLFTDIDYNDKSYYEKYHTIYHLRKELCNNPEKADSRLIYLALHHIVKYRGNFLYEGQTFSLDNSNKIEEMEYLFDKFSDFTECSFDEDTEKINQLLNIFKKKVVRKRKVDECLALFNITKDNKAPLTNLITGLVGDQFNFSKMILNDKVVASDGKDIKLKFSDASYDTKIDEYSGDLGDYIEFIDKMKRIYSWIELNNIIKSDDDEISVSSSMVKRYNEHKEDLKNLKSILRNYDSNIYNEVFRLKDSKYNNYHNYIHNAAKTTRDEFYKYITKILTKIDSDEARKCLNKIENEDFLLKLNHTSNGEIPYQLNLDEMKKIIDNQSKYYECLKENKDKIIKILTVRIPYYYGPLDGNEKFGWLVKNEGKENQRILPWNHEKVVNVEQTATNFIEKLTNYCTYLVDEQVMPKRSLTCSMYEVLSELNKIRVNNKLLSREIKDKIINELFMERKSVSDKELRKWFKGQQTFLNNDDLDIKGYKREESFSTSLIPWIDFKKIFGPIDDTNYELIESIIYDVTVFNEGKILKERLKNKYKLDDEKIKKILKLKYTGWSRLSKKLINGIRTKRNNKQDATILDIMKESNKNLMEIINDDKYDFKEIIEKENSENSKNGFDIDDVNKLAGSPAIKKGIWQSLLVVQELTKYMKCQPENIYIEFAREEGKKRRTTSRVKQLQNIYNELSLQTEHDKSVEKQLKNEKVNSRLDNDRLYLYYTQMGKCMYTGRELDISKLDTYEVDHVLPQSLVMDNSIDNRVLVISSENQRKRDDLVIPSSVRNSQGGFWTYLSENKLISQRKFFNLMRSEISENQQEKFINRQLVETRQIIKHVANIVKNNYDNTNVVTIRAELTRGFRNKNQIYKNRNLNDYHHAHDAYIACVVGQFIRKRFPNLNAKYEYGKYIKSFKKDKKQDNYSFVLHSMDKTYINDETGEIVWDPKRIGDIKKCFSYRDCFVTRKLEHNDGLLFKLTVMPNAKNSDNGKTKATFPVNKKRSDMEKYGGFTNIEYNIYAIEGIENKKSSKTVRKIVGVPVYLLNQPYEDKIAYIEQNKKLNIHNVKIIKEIMVNQLIEWDKGLYYIRSYQELANAWQPLLQDKIENEYANSIIYKVNEALRKKDYANLENSKLEKLYTIIKDKIYKYYPKYSSLARKLEDNYDNFRLLSIEDKANVIDQLLITLSAEPKNGEIKLKGFGISGRIGRLNGKSINLDDVYFIDQSVTGIYSKKYKL